MLETAMNYLQNKYNIFATSWKPRCNTAWNIQDTLQLLYNSLTTKLSTPPFKKIF